MVAVDLAVKVVWFKYMLIAKVGQQRISAVAADGAVEIRLAWSPARLAILVIQAIQAPPLQL
jgi:hypothetical protein